MIASNRPLSHLIQLATQLLAVTWLLFVYWQFDQSFATPAGLLRLGDLSYNSGSWGLARYTLSTTGPGALAFIWQWPTLRGLLDAALSLLLLGTLLGLAVSGGLYLLTRLRLPLRSCHPLAVSGLAGGLGLSIVYFSHALLTFAQLLQPWFAYPLNLLAALLLLGWWTRQGQAVAYWRLRLRAAATVWWQAARQPQRQPLGILLLLATALALLGALVSALAPPVLWDSLYYHLSLPQTYAREGGYSFVQNSYFPIFQQGAEAIFLWPLTLLGADDLRAGSLASLLHWAMTALTALTLYAIARELSLRRLLAVAAAALYLVTPLVGREAGTAYVDNATTLFTLLTLYALWRWWQQRNRWLVLAAVFAGVALATKLYAAFLLPTIAIVVLAACWQSRPQPLSRYLWPLVGALLLAGVVAAPWYVASWLVLGNPVWPSFNTLFHGRYWNDLAEANLQFNIARDSQRDGIGDFSLLNLGKYLGWEISLSNSAPLPRGGQPTPRTMPLLTALLPFALLGWRRLPPLLRWAALYCLAYVVFWAAAQGINRYVLPIFPLLALLAAWSWGWLRERARLAGLALAIFASLTLFTATCANLIFDARAFAYLYGKVERTRYINETAINRLGDDGWATLFISRNTPATARILYNRLLPFYYSNRAYVASDPVIDDVLGYANLRTARQFQAMLGRFGIGYLLFNPTTSSTLAAGLQWGASGAGREQYSHLQYVRGSNYLYKVDGQPADLGSVPLPAGSKLGLLGFDGGIPADLSRAGLAVVNLDGLDRLPQLAEVDYLLVNRQPAAPLLVDEDGGGLVAPASEQLGAVVAQVVSPSLHTAGYDLYPLAGQRGAVQAALHLRPVAAVNWRRLAGNGTVLTNGLSLPLGAPLPFTGNLPPDVQAVVGSDRSLDLAGADVLAVRLQSSPGSTLVLTADLDGVESSLLRDYHNLGGVETVLVRLKGQRLSNLRLSLSGPQGGTGNLRSGRLDQRGGSALVTAQVYSLTLLESSTWQGRAGQR